MSKRTAQLLLHEVVVGRHVDLVLSLGLHLLAYSDMPVLICFLSSLAQQHQLDSTRIMISSNGNSNGEIDGRRN